MRKFLAQKKALALSGVATLASAVNAAADILPADLATVQTGITASSTTYFAIGGGILVVLAGFWGFRKVMGLMGR